MGKSDLIWGIVGRNNAYIVKNGNTEGGLLSKDPFSVTNLHSFANSGLVSTRAVAVQNVVGKKGSKIQVTFKRPRRFNNATKKGFRHGNFSTTIMNGSSAAKVCMRCLKVELCTEHRPFEESHQPPRRHHQSWTES